MSEKSELTKTLEHTELYACDIRIMMARLSAALDTSVARIDRLERSAVWPDAIPHPAAAAEQERRPGKTKLVYDKTTRTIVEHPAPPPAAEQVRRSPKEWAIQLVKMLLDRESKPPHTACIEVATGVIQSAIRESIPAPGDAPGVYDAATVQWAAVWVMQNGWCDGVAAQAMIKALAGQPLPHAELAGQPLTRDGAKPPADVFSPLTPE